MLTEHGPPVIPSEQGGVAQVHRKHPRQAGHVGADKESLGATLHVRPRHAPPCCRKELRSHYALAFCRKGLGGGPADLAAGPGDERYGGRRIRHI